MHSLLRGVVGLLMRMTWVLVLAAVPACSGDPAGSEPVSEGGDDPGAEAAVAIPTWIRCSPTSKPAVFRSSRARIPSARPVPC